jgi:hypothetical protein
VQIPAQPAGDLRALDDQVRAGVDQQLHLAGGLVELRDGQVRLAQRGEGDRLSLDRVGLARPASTATGVSRQAGADTHDLLAGAQQVILQSAGQRGDTVCCLSPDPPSILARIVG